MWLEQREVGSGRTEVREVAGEQITWGRIVHSTAVNEVSRGRTRSHLHFNRLTLAHEWRTHYMEQSEDRSRRPVRRPCNSPGRTPWGPG